MNTENISELVKATFDVKEIEKYWFNTIGMHHLGENETVRVTYAIPDGTPEEGESQKFKNTQLIPSRPINCTEVLLQELNNLMVPRVGVVNQIGVSMSSSVFKFIDKDTTQSSSNFEYKHSFVLDVDCYDEFENSRINLSGETNLTIYYNAYYIYALICNQFLKQGIIPFKPKGVYMTGGGYQFVMKWDETKLNRTQSIAIGRVMSKLFTKTKQDIMQFGTYFNDSELSYLTMEFDGTSSDIVHTQRVCGTNNIKYGSDCRAIELTEFSKKENYDDIMLQANNFYNNLSDSSKFKKDEFEASRWLRRKTSIDLFMSNYFKGISINNLECIQDWESMAELVKHEPENRSQAGKLNQNDYEFLHKIPISVVKETMYDILKDKSKIKLDGMKHMTCECPFHDDGNASFAIYYNEGGVARMADFHPLSNEDKEKGWKQNYNFLEFWMAYYRKSKGEAMEEIASLSGISMDKNFYKSLHSAETEKTIEELISAVDTTDYVYYRLANKASSAVIRNMKTGETSKFDGSRVLSDHVLSNQLNRPTADYELKKEFFVQFDQFIIFDAFEEFNPGAPTKYEIDGIQFVNLWVPSEKYKRIHSLSETMEDMDIDDALRLMEKELPWMYIYLHQITQKGHLPFFVNWLANIAHYNVSSVIPVITSVQGTGKNLFIDEVINPYFNENYVNVVDGKKLANNFNSYMEDSSLIVVDEGDFSKTQEVDNIKYLSGNNKILIERKGIDTVSRTRKFNFLMLTNGLVPIRHPINDRRFSYYRLDVNLETTCREKNTNIEQFIDNIREESDMFWAIILKINRISKWNNSNLKDSQFFKQILLMHRFGQLVTQVLNEDWLDISLQMNEKVMDKAQIQANLSLMKTIQQQYSQTGTIQMALINKYINSLNYKDNQSITEFINSNFLKEYGIHVIQEEADMKIKIDKDILLDKINISNNLEKIIPDYFIKQKELKEKQERISQGLQTVNMESSVESSPTGGPTTIMDTAPSIGVDNFSGIGLPPSLDEDLLNHGVLQAPGATYGVIPNTGIEQLNAQVDPEVYETIH